jgi:general secretion pathway protein M
MMRMTPKQSKAAALAILVLLVAVVITAVALPLWLLNRRYDAAVDDAATRLARYSRVVGMRDGLQAKAVQVKALEASHHFLKSASPTLAAAELQELVKTILDANGGKLNSFAPLPYKDEGAYRQVPVALQLNAPLSAVKATLYALESARPYLFVDNLSIRAPFNVGTRLDSSTEPELNVQFNVTGYAMKGAQ